MDSQQDVVGAYIQLKEIESHNKERLSALETLILANFRNDKRITIVAPRKTIIVKDEVYENLESVGISTTVVEERRKKLEEFDIEIQNSILNNEENYTLKLSKESIRIKKSAKGD